MKKLIFIAALLGVGFLAMGCHISLEPLPPGTVYVSTVPHGDTDGAICYEDPYLHDPLWCDYYDDYSACCVWYVDDWHEEWCAWDYDYGCWEYVASW